MLLVRRSGRTRPEMVYPRQGRSGGVTESLLRRGITPATDSSSLRRHRSTRACFTSSGSFILSTSMRDRRAAVTRDRGVGREIDVGCGSPTVRLRTVSDARRSPMSAPSWSRRFRGRCGAPPEAHGQHQEQPADCDRPTAPCGPEEREKYDFLANALKMFVFCWLGSQATCSLIELRCPCSVYQQGYPQVIHRLCGFPRTP